MKKIDTSMLKYVGKVILITLFTIFVIRFFFFESFTISTSQMESALIEGDEVLVSKVSYGPRLPITPLNIPFTFDRFFGKKSYSTLLELPYKRLYSSPVLRNDVVVFNSTLETDKPLDKRSLLISRCVAVPGDTIMITDGVYYINGYEYVHSPTQIDEYVALTKNFGKLAELSDSLYLEMKRIYTSNDSTYFSLNRYDAFLLNRNSRLNGFYRKDYVIPQTLVFIAPSAGRKVALSENNIKLYKQVIEYEKGERAVFKNDALYLDGKHVVIYAFEDDYYWMLSDNTIDALDSRSLGFIPYKNIEGRATTILYSKGERGLRADRFFMDIR